MRSYRLAASLACGGLILLASQAVAAETTIAAAAGYRRPLTELAAAYAATSGDQILQVYGHVGQVVAQAQQSDQIALVCGDKVTLDGAKNLSFSRWLSLGAGQLVVAYRKGITLAKAEDIADASLKRIGIPDQANAIYGKAGRQFLDRAGLASGVDPRLVPVAMVPQVTSYLATGELDAGFINATDAIGAGDTIGGFVKVDPDRYDAVDVACGVRAGDVPKALAGFLAFLGTSEAHAILGRYGL